MAEKKPGIPLVAFTIRMTTALPGGMSVSTGITTVVLAAFLYCFLP